MRTQKETLILKIKAFGVENRTTQHFKGFKGIVALKCVCSADRFGSVYYPDAFKYVVELIEELKSGQRVDDELLFSLNKWFRLPAERGSF